MTGVIAIRKAWLEGRLDARGSQTAFARKIGVTRAYVHGIVADLRDDPDAVASKKQAPLPDGLRVLPLPGDEWIWHCQGCKRRNRSRPYETRPAAHAGALRHATTKRHLEGRY